jgi:YggT family protein
MSDALALTVATVRGDIASYVNAAFTVYLICIFIYVVFNLLFSVGVRLPYWPWLHTVLRFLGEVVEPYLRIFRRFMPMPGGLDFSPMLATFALFIVWRVVVSLIEG